MFCYKILSLWCRIFHLLEMGRRSKASWCGEGKRARVLVLVLAKDPEKEVIFTIFKCKVATLSFLTPYWVVGSKQNH